MSLNRIHLSLILIAIALCIAPKPLVAQDSNLVLVPEPEADSALRILEMQERIAADPYDGEAYTTLGILLTREEKYEEARAAFISAIQIAPAEPMTHFNLAVCLVKMEDWESAVQPLTSFNSLDPEDGRGYLILGEVEKQLGDLEAAREQWESGIRMPGVEEETKVNMLHRLVASFEEEDDLRGAVGELEKFEPLLVRDAYRDLRGLRVGLYMTLAKETETSGEVEESLQWLAKARGTGEAPITAWTAAAELLLNEERVDEAEALATETLESPAGTNAYLRARVAEKQGDLNAASRYYKEALRADPEFPSAWGYLGGVLAQLGDTKGADEALAKAAARGEGGVAAKYNLAIMKTKEGDYRGAIPLLQEVVREDPTLKDAHRALAAAYRKEKNYRAAAEVSQNIVDSFGPSSNDLYQLAYSQAKLEEHSKAAENYRMVTAMEPENFNAFYGLGRSLSKLGRHDDAIEALDRAVELQPDNEIAVFNLAFALQKANRYEDAIDAYLEASDLKETARSYTNIAICYQNLGDKDAADEYYQKADDLKKKG